MKRAWYRGILRRRIAVILLLILQGFFIVYVLSIDSPIAEFVRVTLHVVSVVIVFHVISQKNKGAHKVMWIFLNLLFPLFGGALYLLYHFQSSTRRFRQAEAEIAQENRELYQLPGDAYEQAKEAIPQHLPQIRYLQQLAGFPVFDAAQTRYFSPGETFVPVFLEELRKAERYIFLEYFIIEGGTVWDSILEILKEKAARGVEVRLIYDDIGCFLTLPKNYARQLKEYGIKCMVFNPFRPVLSVAQNNRDHRKITSIDGKVAFTGGLNLADEYANIKEKYGYWKDSAIRVEGKAAWSLTLMFLEMWQLCTREKENCAEFYPWKGGACPIAAEGFVQPYADSPMDDENVGEHVYVQILNNAKDYVYITSPYLIVDDSMVSALCLAAKSGVDVRIITPHIWDKALIHMTTRSYYRELIQGGVKIYEYTKGFIHSKTFVSDDHTTTVGTTNLDFRSLYLHFECGVWMYDSDAVRQVKEDFLTTLKECEEMTLDGCKVNPITRLFQDVLRLVAPLL